MAMQVSKLIRLLKSSKEENLLTEKELETNCSKCGKRPATDPDGLCNNCRFDDAITRIAERKQMP